MFVGIADTGVKYGPRRSRHDRLVVVSPGRRVGELISLLDRFMQPASNPDSDVTLGTGLGSITVSAPRGLKAGDALMMKSNARTAAAKTSAVMRGPWCSATATRVSEKAVSDIRLFTNEP